MQTIPYRLLTSITFIILLAAASPVCAQEITFNTLLHEMADLDALARYPHPVYQSLQASSYNRRSVVRDQPDQGTSGWFADSDGVGFIRKEIINGEKEWVVMEHDGPGCLTKMWTPFFYYNFNNRVGPRIKIYLDGADKPAIDENFIELLTRGDWPDSYGAKPQQQNRFQAPSPFADFTARAGDLYLPIPFASRCKITLDNKPFYNIVNYRAYPKGTKVKSFSMDQYRASRSQLARVGKKLLSPPDRAVGKHMEAKGPIKPGESMSLVLPQGAAAMRHLAIQLDPQQVRKNPALLRSTVLKITFDGEQSVWCPLGDFFASPNRINAFNTYARSTNADGLMICRWVMPYQKEAVVSLENLGEQPVTANMAATTDRWRWNDRSMHFHARWRPDHIQQGHQFVDWNFIDIQGMGVIVGDQWTVLNLTRGWWGEGDEKIYIDEAYDKKKFPDHFGTGTEDYYGWAGGVNPTKEDVFDHPWLANASVGSTDENNTRGFNVCVRQRGLDAVPFTKRLRFDMEASPGVDQRNHWNLLGYSAVTFFYTRPAATHNRPASPDAAAQRVMSLKKLDRRSNELKNSQSR